MTAFFTKIFQNQRFLKAFFEGRLLYKQKFFLFLRKHKTFVMEITLPKRIDGQPAQVLTGKQQITVVGANGAGKTRFINRMAQDLGDTAFQVSALNALFTIKDNAIKANSISAIYNNAVQNAQFVKPIAETEFEMLLYLLLNDEITDLFAYKLQMLNSDKKLEMPRTKIDTVARLWQDIFPKNEILRGNGQIKFRNLKASGPFKPLQLSHGEKAVFYYVGAALYAPKHCVIFVDSPTMFLHRSITQSLWTAIEGIRPDCTFVYLTHDLEFPTSRTDNLTIWVRNCDIEHEAWDYTIMNPHETLSEQLMLDILGARKPVLFVEGDSTHSIDYKLYSLIFPEYTVKPMGSCNKVIETVRSFNDIQNFHHLDSHGIVDRDRRNKEEVDYLRNKKILVADVAEIENLFLLENVVRTVARVRNKKEDYVFQKVRSTVMSMFKGELRKQALMHTRHRVKRTIEVVIDRRFQNINALEEHMLDLVNEIKPRAIYEDYCRSFNRYLQESDYKAVLRVYNQKSMLIETNIAPLCGFTKKDEYIKEVMRILKMGGKDAEIIRTEIKKCFGIGD